MLICAAGDCHGRLGLMYEVILDLEAQVGRKVDLVLQVGDLGIWPDSSRADKPTIRRAQTGDFEDWHKQGFRVPRPTIFIAGNHDDFNFLQTRKSGEILPDLIFLAWGDVWNFNTGGKTVRIGGLGGCYSSRDFSKKHLTGRNRRHYTKHDLDKLIKKGKSAVDILLLHDAPEGEIENLIIRPGRTGKRTSHSLGLNELVRRISPSLVLTGHLHIRSERQLSGIRTIGLNMIPRAGCLMLFEFRANLPLVDVCEYIGFFSATRGRKQVSAKIWHRLRPKW
jgi:DNA repair exonuclease SbcCD nuclease subunit